MHNACHQRMHGAYASGFMRALTGRRGGGASASRGLSRGARAAAQLLAVRFGEGASSITMVTAGTFAFRYRRRRSISSDHFRDFVRARAQGVPGPGPEKGDALEADLLALLDRLNAADDGTHGRVAVRLCRGRDQPGVGGPVIRTRSRPHCDRDVGRRGFAREDVPADIRKSYRLRLIGSPWAVAAWGSGRAEGLERVQFLLSN